jgi:hypothetical protein
LRGTQELQQLSQEDWQQPVQKAWSLTMVGRSDAEEETSGSSGTAGRPWSWKLALENESESESESVNLTWAWLLSGLSAPSASTRTAAQRANERLITIPPANAN